MLDSDAPLLKRLRWTAVAAFLVASGPLTAEEPLHGGRLAWGTATGQPGEIVEVMVRGGFSFPAMALDMAFHYDSTRLRLVGNTTEGTMWKAVEPVTPYHREVIKGEATGGYRVRGSGLSPFAQPGEDLVVARFLFQVRPDAAEGAAFLRFVDRVERIGNNYSVWKDGSSVSQIVDAFVAASVTVTEPSGPRPVDDVSCKQILNRVELTFEPTEIYDEIEIRQNDELVGVVAGDATGIVVSIENTVGLILYDLVARRAGIPSVVVSCELVATVPTAPAIEDFSCEGGQLRWSNPVVYDGLRVHKNGELLVELPGTAQSHADSGAGPEQIAYTIIGELDGFSSPEVHCLLNAPWTARVGDILVSTDASRILLPVYGTTSLVVQGVQFSVLTGDPRLQIVQNDEIFLGTASDTGPEIVFVGNSPPDGGDASISMIYDAFPPREPQKLLGPGLEQHIMNFVFDMDGFFEDGEVIDVEIRDLTTYTANLRSVKPSVRMNGSIRFGQPKVKSVGALRATVDEEKLKGLAPQSRTHVRLDWTNRERYDSILVERNGVELAVLPGEFDSFVDTDLPGGVFTYRLAARRADEAALPVSTFVSTVSPLGTFIRGDANRDRQLDISDPVTILRAIFLGGSPLTCQDAADANDDGRLDIADPIAILVRLFLGGNLPEPRGPFPWLDSTADALSCTD